MQRIKYKEISLDSEKIELFIQNETLIAEWNSEEFKYLWFLIEKVPKLSDLKYLKEFCEISNFFWKGMKFQVIHSIPTYQHDYIKRVEMEYSNPADIFPYRLTDYKIFDLSVMHEPKVENGNVLFYVCNIENGLPYRVVCPFPYPFASTKVHYQILPVLE